MQRRTEKMFGFQTRVLTLAENHENILLRPDLNRYILSLNGITCSSSAPGRCLYGLPCRSE
jgi:hypothetical protein